MKQDVKNELFELTNPQKPIWLTEQMYSDTNINNVCGVLTVKEDLNVQKFILAINKFIAMNDSYRLRLTINSGEIFQYFSDYSYTDFPVVFLNSEEELETLKKSTCKKPFSLLDSPLFTFTVFKLNNGFGGFVLNSHHIISDAWSSGLSVNSIIDIYNSLLVNKDSDIICSNNYSYKEFILSERKYLNNSKYLQDKSYWLELFKDMPESATIPYTKSEIPITQNQLQANRKMFELSSDILSQINCFCSKNKISLYNFFIAVFSLYISKVSSSNVFAVGTPILNRTNYAEKHMTGMFINTLPLKIEVDDNSNFCDFVSSIGLNIMSMLRHQKYSYQNILQDIRDIQESSIPGLYNVMISYQNTKMNSNNNLIEHESSWVFNQNIANDLDIHLFEWNDNSGLNIAYDYNMSKYDDIEMENIHNRILNMINQICTDDNVLLKNINVITKNDETKLLNLLCNTNTAYESSKTIHELFEKNVLTNPDKIAVIFEDETLTYSELNKKANSLANYLRNTLDVSSNSFIGIMTHRSLNMVVGLLGIIKSGAAYIPIDPDYPIDRIEYMLSHSNTKHLLVASSTKNLLSDFNLIDIELSDDNIIYKNYDNSNLLNINSADDLIYTIYTSGSTGKPKGVMLTHKNINNYITGLTNIVDFKDDKIFVSVTTICFDIFVTELWACLLNNVKIILANEDEQKIPMKLNELCLKHNVNMIQTTPSRFNLILSEFCVSNHESFINNITDLMVGGESLPKTLLESLYKYSNLTVYNMYGPTETAVWSAIKKQPDINNITIGKPISNTQIYILDDNMNLLPPYSTGNLYIGGDGVSNGYLNRDDLTSAVFVKSPFDNSIIYNTNDLAYAQYNGELVHLGRSDFQVKINGYRVEIGEIESVIQSYQNIISTAVIYNKDLIGFYVSNINIDEEDLRNYMAMTLPNYMIPKYFIKLDTIPLTPNGKVDRKNDIFKNFKLPTKETTQLILATNVLEEQVLSVVCKVLNVNIGITDNIFTHGADSLSIIKIVSILYKYNIVINVQDFYTYPTIQLLCANINNTLLNDNNIDNTSYLNYQDVKNISNLKQHINYTNIGKDFLLTGATGFYGIHILAELLDTTDLNVYCLIRDKNNIDAKTRLLNNLSYYFDNKYSNLIDTRIFVINSDISAPDLNISNEDYSMLGNNISHVIHSAADVRHFGNYDTSKKANLTSTLNMIEFCKKFNIMLHHISTLTVSGYGLVDVTSNEIFDENSFYIGQNYNDNIYVKSKYLSELAIFNELKNGLICNIYRLGNLTNRFSDSKLQLNYKENAFLNRLSIIKNTKMIPDFIKNSDIEISPVDICAKALICLITKEVPNNNLNIFNLYNPNIFDNADLVKCYLNCGLHVSFANEDLFLNELSSNTNIDLYQYSSFFNEKMTNLSCFKHETSFSNTITTDTLSKHNFKWPKIPFSYIENILKML